MDIEQNVHQIRAEFGDPKDLKVRFFTFGSARPRTGALLYFLDLTEDGAIPETILRPLMIETWKLSDAQILAPDLISKLQNEFLLGAETETVSGFNQAVQALLGGRVILLVDGHASAIAINLRQEHRREIQEPDVEMVITGPREGFVETISRNIGLIRRRIATPSLRVQEFQLGEKSQTRVTLIYIAGLADDRIVSEAISRLNKIQVEAVFDPGQLEDFLEDAPWSPFPTWGTTERVDVCAAQLLEGCVAILTDGSPVCLFAPVTFLSFFQTPDDYYMRYPAATLARWLRLSGISISLVFPSLYLAIVNFHPEMIPFALLVTIAEAKERIPFPLVVEILLMEAVFEMLREAGLRMPRPIGQALTIVGPLVIGQAAVQAGLVAAPVIVVVATTAIGTFLIAREKVTQATRILRFPLLILTALFGMFGLILGMIAVLTHQVSLRSLGVPYMYPLAPLDLKALRDVLIRSPKWDFQSRRVAVHLPEDEGSD